jgi:hypothetical protein
MSPDFNAAIGSPRRRTAAERRRHARQSFSADAEIVEVVSGTRLRMTARVADLSMGGCYLDTINPFAPGALAHLRIHSRNTDLLCVATVKSCQPGMGMGLAFEGLTKANSDLLKAWLDDSSSTATEDVEAEDMLKAGQAIIVPEISVSGGLQSHHDALSIRLAKLLHTKGVLNDTEIVRLLGKDIL